MEEIRKPFIVNVFLNERIYNPGDTVQGEIELELRKRMLCDLITAQIYGAARVFFVSHEGEENGQYAIAHEQKKVLIDETKVIWGTESRPRKLQKPTLEEIVKHTSSLSIRPKKLERKEDNPGFDAGRHVLGFSFDLPKSGLNVSYCDHDCGIRYYIKVQCYNYQQLVAIGKAEFPVVCPVNLMDIPEARGPKEVNENIVLKKGGCIDVKISLSQRGFVPAERLPVKIKIDNHSRHSIKYAHLTIEKHLCGFATYPFPLTIQYVTDTSGVGLPIPKILAGESFEYSPAFFVPALVPNFELDELLSLNYSLKLDISYERKCHHKKDILKSIKIPIYIGTVPLEHPVLQSKPFCYNRQAKAGLENSEYFEREVFGEPPPGYLENDDTRSYRSSSSELSCPSYSSLFSSDKTGLLSEEKKKKL